MPTGSYFPKIGNLAKRQWIYTINMCACTWWWPDGLGKYHLEIHCWSASLAWDSNEEGPNALSSNCRDSTCQMDPLWKKLDHLMTTSIVMQSSMAHSTCLILPKWLKSNNLFLACATLTYKSWHLFLTQKLLWQIFQGNIPYPRTNIIIPLWLPL